MELYHSAIRLQQDGDFSKAKDIYRQILESEVMEEVGGASHHTTLSKLKYLVLKNIAAIAREQGDLSAALDAYIEVCVTLRCVCVCPRMRACSGARAPPS